MKVKIKKLHKDAIIPTYATEGSACVDLYTIEDYIFKPNEFVKFVRFGISIEIPEGYYGEIYNRSGLSAKKEIVIISSGIIDCDYRGELFIPMRLIADIPVVSIKKGDRVAQLIIKKYEKIDFKEVVDLNSTKRGFGGFGSTGK